MPKTRSPRSEVRSKSDAMIERQTAHKWADHAIDSLVEYAKNGNVPWLIRAEGYKHEAVEHAGTVYDYGKTAGIIQRKIEKAERGLLGVARKRLLKASKKHRGGK